MSSDYVAMASPLRERLGRMVREVWIEWAREQPNPKPSWLVPWEGLSEADREVDRRIGETLYAQGLSDTLGAQIRASEVSTHEYSCPVCDGRGYELTGCECHMCGGTGWVAGHWPPQTVPTDKHIAESAHPAFICAHGHSYTTNPLLAHVPLACGCARPKPGGDT